MAGPITWRNVGATADTGGVAALLSGGQRAAESGFNALRDVLNQQRATDDYNYEKGNERVTNDFMKQLYGFKNDADFQSARDSGALQQMLASTGNRGDQAAMLEALDSRGTDLRARDTSRNQFADETQLRNQRGIEATYRQMLVNDPAGAQAYLQQNSEGMIGAGKLAIEGQEVGFAQQDQQNQNQQTRNSTAQVGIAQNRANLAARAQQRQFASMDKTEAAADRLKLLDTTSADYSQQFMQDKQTYDNATAAGMMELGYANDPSKADPATLGDEQKQALDSWLTNKGVENPGSSTDYRNRLLQDADKNLNLSSSEVAKLSQGFDATLGSMSGLSQRDTQRIQGQQQADNAIFDRREKNNLFYVDPNLGKVESREKYLDPILKDTPTNQWFGNDRKLMSERFDEWTAGKGFEYRSNNGNWETIPLSGKFVADAWEEASAKDDPEDHIMEIIQERLKNMNVKEQMLDAEKLVNQRQASDASYSRKLTGY